MKLSQTTQNWNIKTFLSSKNFVGTVFVVYALEHNCLKIPSLSITLESSLRYNWGKTRLRHKKNKTADLSIAGPVIISRSMGWTQRPIFEKFLFQNWEKYAIGLTLGKFSPWQVQHTDFSFESHQSHHLDHPLTRAREAGEQILPSPHVFFGDI